MGELEKTIGLIIKSQSGFYTVLPDEAKKTVVCQLRGKIKKGRREGDLCSIGDKVLISVLDDGSGAIEEILPRKNAIVRLDPRPQGEYQQILIANADQAVFVFACSRPEPHLRMLDRFLVIAEKQAVPPLIVFNKVDQIGIEQAREKFGLYERIGYPTLFTSVEDGTGVAELEERMRGKISALAGPSGVGKSSLMNAIESDMDLATNALSDMNNKGRHTTNFRQMHPLTKGGWVADAPGWKSLGLWDTYPEEIDAYFPDIEPFVANCAFSDCSHIHEPGCAVLKAVEDGLVDRSRYDSYTRLRQG